MKSLQQHIEEKLIINKNYTDPYTYVPKSPDELRKIIEQRYEEQGAGTKKNPIDFNDIDVSKIDSFFNGTIGIFEGTEFKYIDISSWNISNIKNMQSMFYMCEKLKSVGDLSNWNVSNVKDMSYMFYGCEKLESVGDLSDWNVSNVKLIYFMFAWCRNLKSVGNLSHWDISSIENMTHMFYSSGITNIPSWYKE